jgi:hypothetical protein
LFPQNAQSVADNHCRLHLIVERYTNASS